MEHDFERVGHETLGDCSTRDVYECRACGRRVEHYRGWDDDAWEPKREGCPGPREGGHKPLKRDRPGASSDVYVVLTEVNGYRNAYGHTLFHGRAMAEEAAEEARAKGCWDSVWVQEWKVV